MKEMTHRDMRNHSAELLRQIAAGESVLVTNNGRPAALVTPPNADPLATLAANGQVRRATASVTSLRHVKRSRSSISTAAILEDLRGDR